MTAMTHAMSHTARSTRAMEPRMGRSEARAVTDTSCSSHSTTVTTADVSSASPMNGAALTVNGLRVLRMRRCLA
jgi:hypothetical protein